MQVIGCRILRAMAAAQGIRPLGTLGILLDALRHSILSKGEARRLLDALVGLHDFRIGIEVYQAVIAQIDAALCSPLPVSALPHKSSISRSATFTDSI